MSLDVRAVAAGPGERRVAFAVAAVLAALTLVLMPFARIALEPIPAIMPAIGGVAAVALLATAFLLATQGEALGIRGFGALGAAFAVAGITVVPWAMLFHGVVPGLPEALHVRGDAVGWLYVAWHAALVGGILAYRFGMRAPSRRTVSRTAVTIVAAALWLPLPRLATPGWTSLFLFAIGPLLIGAALVAAVAVGRRRSAAIDLWLRVLGIAVACDVASSWSAIERFTLGWYASRVFAVTAATVVLGVLLSRIARLYAEVASEAQRLDHDAHTDALTGVANRRQFELRAALALERAQRTQTPLAVALIDIDRFKRYNDRYGHLAGDACLRTVARVLAASLGEADALARYGGEEFIVLFEDTDVDGGIVAVERARAALLITALPHADGPAGVVTFSAGVASVAPGDTLGSLLERADVALYAAKRAGRDRVCRGERVVSAA